MLKHQKTFITAITIMEAEACNPWQNFSKKLPGMDKAERLIFKGMHIINWLMLIQ